MIFSSTYRRAGILSFVLALMGGMFAPASHGQSLSVVFPLPEDERAFAMGVYLKVSFQPAEAGIPSGFIADNGLRYGDRGNGYVYGWSRDVTAAMHERKVRWNVEKEIDTVCALDNGASWQIDLPNGSYEVTLGMGDSLRPSMGNVLIYGTYTRRHRHNRPEPEDLPPPPELAKGHFLQLTQTVEVEDGRLTMVARAGAAITHLIIRSASHKPRNTALGDRNIPAFPGAEGYGRFARGGRGGDVYHVTNLDDSGPGSLRHGIETINGPRTIVFSVGGTIRLQKPLVIRKISGLTIAGQTAPGDGITIAGRVVSFVEVADVIVRFIRFRLGDEIPSSDDTIGLDYARHVIFDHINSTWGVDGNMDTSSLSDFTLQWSIFAEALHDSNHTSGGHAMLLSMRRPLGNVTLHHNLMASSRDRHPSLGGGNPFDPTAIFDFRNNVIYNWEGGTDLNYGWFNIVGNYYRPGPNTNERRHPIQPKASMEGHTRGYLAGNFFEGYPEWTESNYDGVNLGINEERWGAGGGKYPANLTLGDFRQPNEIVAEGDRPFTHQAEHAYEHVLRYAGASLRRDAADERLIKGIRDRTGRRIDSQTEVGGYPELRSGEPPVDTDRDGMPDQWEREHGLDPNDPSDRNQVSGLEGYTYLEKYLNSLVPVKRLD